MINDQRITQLSALIMPQMVIDENIMSMASEEVVLSGREVISDAINRDCATKVLICSFKPTADGQGYSFDSVIRFAEKLCCLRRSWQRQGVAVEIIFELELSTLLDLNSIEPNNPRLFHTSIKRTSEAGAYNRSIMNTRALLCEITQMGLYPGFSLDDPLMPQYYGDQLCWSAILEENVESQLHRQLASAMSIPVAFIPKSMNKGPGKALDACLSAKGEHTFFSMTKEGAAALVSSSGNDNCHVVVPVSNRDNIDDIAKTIQAKQIATKLFAEVDLVDFKSRTDELKDLLNNKNVAGFRTTVMSELDADPSVVLDRVPDIFSQRKTVANKRQRVD